MSTSHIFRSALTCVLAVVALQIASRSTAQVLARRPASPPAVTQRGISRRPASPTAFASRAIAEKRGAASPQGTLSGYNSGDPTAEEQWVLERINWARAHPDSEGIRLAKVDDQYVNIDYQLWGTPTRAQVKADFATYAPKPPLAFNAALIKSATGHSNEMLLVDSMFHYGPDGSPQSRDQAAGYSSQYVGENIGAYDRDLEEAHDGFMVDFGNPALGHRKNCMDIDLPGLYTEIGIGIIHGGNGLPDVGPLITTEDLGDAGKTFVLGVVYDDKNHNGFYDIGEGLSGVTITVSGASQSAVTSTSGGYAIPFTGSGMITVTASGGGLASPISHQVDFNAQNVKVDFTKDYTGLPAQVQLLLPASLGTLNVDTAHFTWSTSTGATTYHLQLSTDSTFKTLVLDDPLLTKTSRTYPNLKDSTTYFWRVQAKNAKGWGMYSAIGSFSVALVPSVVLLVAPANGANTGSADVTFSWQNPNPVTVTAYWIELSISATFTSDFRSDTINDLSSPNETISGVDFQPGQTYYWRVRAQNDNGWGMPSATRSFVAGSAGVAGEAGIQPIVVFASPNPTTGETHIHFSLANYEDVSIKLFNSIGEEIETMNLGKLAPNDYSISWNGASQTDGMYVYQLRIGERVEVGRIAIVR